MTIRITPLSQTGKAIELSQGTNVFEKQVLPIGKFSYKGDTFEITEGWIDNAIQAFTEKATNQTTFALADENNSHDVDHRPDRFGGEVLRFVKRGDGLNAVLRLTDRVAGLIRDNPNLGVSVRFTEGYRRDSDQRSWPVVIDQVLGTLNPRLTGMAPWKEITLSNLANGTEVADSSEGEWTMPDKDEDTTSKPTQETGITLTQAEYGQLQALLKNSTNDNGDTNNGNVDPSSGSGGDSSTSGSPSTVKEPVKLSKDAKRIVQLSGEVARSRFDASAAEWARQGVPPKIIELAAPVLSSYETVKVVTLSDDGTTNTVDARNVLRQILDECKGTVNLSQETGNAGSGSDQDKEFEAIYNAVLAEARQF